ncbi:DUF3953 domain-containing protein [Salipaludibacillus daqingensis]|uniref:DUF3953 domain-containing protein n=1 Tax=Salipaludibacillus daqingensis TaxID=3041001 RepID=UPI002474A9DF|nr:DUF3953 domain-containing protein [Salipaludibacillus daqingensis]
MFFKILVTVFAILTIITAGYGLLNSTDKYTSYMLFFLGGTILMMGLAEIKRAKKSFWGYMSSAVAVFIYIVWIQDLY